MGVFTDAAKNLIAPRRVNSEAPINPTPTQLSYPQSQYDPSMQTQAKVRMMGNNINLRVSRIKNGYLISTGHYEGDLLQHYYAEDLKAVGEYVTAYCVEQELTK